MIKGIHDASSRLIDCYSCDVTSDEACTHRLHNAKPNPQHNGVHSTENKPHYIFTHNLFWKLIPYMHPVLPTRWRLFVKLNLKIMGNNSKQLNEHLEQRNSREYIAAFALYRPKCKLNFHCNLYCAIYVFCQARIK